MSIFSLHPYLNRQFTLQQPVTVNYPPTDIYYREDNSTSPDIIIDMALAGFSKDNISVSVSPNNELVIEGKQPKSDESTVVIHKGISKKSFSRQFKLTAGSAIKSCTMDNGILTVVITPEQEKPPLQIPIK